MPSISQCPALKEYREQLQRAGRHYLECGFILIPLRPWDKRPAKMTKWQQREGQIHTVEELDYWLNHKNGIHGLGLHCGLSKVYAIDFDIRNKEGYPPDVFTGYLHNNEQLRQRLIEAAPGCAIHTATEDATAYTIDGKTYTAHGQHLLFKHDYTALDLGNTTGGIAPQIDTRGNGGYIVLPPTVIQRPPSEGGTWHRYAPTDTGNGEKHKALPPIPEELRQKLIHKQRPTHAMGLPLATITNTPAPLEGAATNPQHWVEHYIKQARVGNRNERGFLLACQLRDSAQLPQIEAAAYMRQYQRAVDTQGNPYTEEEALISLESAYTEGARPAAMAMANQSQQRQDEAINEEALLPLPDTLSARYTNAYAPTDTGNGRRLVEASRGNLYYIVDTGRWVAWDGRQWATLAKEQAIRYAKLVAEYINNEYLAAPLESPQRKALGAHYLRSQNAPRVAAMLDMAAADLAAYIGQFDNTPDELPCRNGVIDLRNGQLMPHDPRRLNTKITNIDYNPNAKAPAWAQFMATITANDAAVQRYIQQAVGYSLTGRIDMQCLFFLYGNGANGKSTFINTLAKLAGDYYRKINIDALLDKGGKDSGAANPYIVDMVGMRLTSGGELPANKRLNEALVKELTGGDMVATRALYRDVFTFRPINKYWLNGNYKPRIIGTDEGIWRRMVIIPFTHTIPEPQRRPAAEIEAIFDAELPGILAWAIQGAIDWYAAPNRQLQRPAAIEAAILEYREEEDTIQRYITEQCHTDATAQVKKNELYSDFELWMKAQGEYSRYSAKQFTRELTKRGFNLGGSGNSYYKGLRLARQPALDLAELPETF